MLPLSEATAQLPGAAVPRRAVLALAGVCLAGIALRIFVGWWSGFLSDLTIYQIWAAEPGEVRLPAVYKPTICNYPPIYPSVLKLLRRVHAGLGLPGDFSDPIMFPSADEGHSDHIAAQRPLILLLKMPAILADAISAVLIFAIGVRLRGAWTGVALASFYLFSPAILYDGAYYGQTDTVLLMFLLAAVWAWLTRRPVWLGASMVAAFLFKAQAFVVLLVLTAAILGQWRSVWGAHWRRLLGGGLGALAGAAALAAATGQLIQFYNGYFIIVGFFPIVTSRAFNLWWLMTRPWHKAPFEADFPMDTELLLGLLSYRAVGMIMFWAAIAVILWLLHRARYTPQALVLAAAAAGWAFFNLPTEIHERYAVPAVGVMCLLPIQARRWYLMTTVVSLTVMFNITNLAPLQCPPLRQFAYYVNTFIWPEQQFAWTIFAIIHILMLPLCVEMLWRQKVRT